MPRLIDADNLMVCVNRKHGEVGKTRYTEGFNDAILRVRSMIHSAKTIDAIEVVRCKDCVYSSGFAAFACPMVREVNLKDNDFCSRGERKTDE